MSEAKNNNSGAVAPPIAPGQAASAATRAPLKHKPGDKLEVFERGVWVPCIILSIATYVGKSGPGYYASYDPWRKSCGSFWCYDHVLRGRHTPSKRATES